MKSGNDYSLYKDGVSFYSFSDADTTTFDAPFIIGDISSSNTYPFDGYIDEFRVTKGVARWTTDFTPLTSTYSVDSPKVQE